MYLSLSLCWPFYVSEEGRYAEKFPAVLVEDENPRAWPEQKNAKINWSKKLTKVHKLGETEICNLTMEM